MKILKFNAVWCPACLVMKKVIKEVQKNYPDIEFIDYDYDLSEEEVKKWNIGKILPVYIFLNNNQETARLIGEKKYTDFTAILEKK